MLCYAKENGYAIPAVNCVSSSSINACIEAARKMDAPIMIQFSAGGAQCGSPLHFDLISTCIHFNSLHFT